MKRESGILLHPTSLPGKYGIGSLGSQSRWFVDWLSEHGQKVWQILPLNPTGFNHSPYQCYSAFAGNPNLIDLDELEVSGYLEAVDLITVPHFSGHRVDFDAVIEFREPVLHKAFMRFRETGGFGLPEYMQFWDEHAWWLDSYSLFYACHKNLKGKTWNSWEDAIATRTEGALHFYYRRFREDVEYQRFLQFMFFRQWFALKQYANEKGVEMMGDIPLYVSYDSADVWANQDLFMLDEKRKPVKVGGVPPDYFSETGQRWGNPLYRWERLKERGFDWWLARIHFNLNMFDQVRIDHFRGLESFWAIPYGEKTAVKGEWLPALGDELFRILRDQLGNLPIVAEDLGTITEEVHALRKKYGFPGMKVLQFAFDSEGENEYLPHNYRTDFVVYTGTHDNNTTRGWWKSLTTEERRKVLQYLQNPKEEKHWQLIRLALSSVAKTAIIPFQDVLGLDERARMNTPGTVDGNWHWRFTSRELHQSHGEKLLKLTRLYAR